MQQGGGGTQRGRTQRGRTQRGNSCSTSDRSDESTREGGCAGDDLSEHFVSGRKECETKDVARQGRERDVKECGKETNTKMCVDQITPEARKGIPTIASVGDCPMRSEEVLI